MGTVTQFSELPEHIVRNVLEYVPLLDRVRFEAVNSFWNYIVRVMFESQTSLAVTYGSVRAGWLPGYGQYGKCVEHDHKFYEIDVVFVNVDNSRAIILNLVKRCPKLKHFYFATSGSCGDLATLLNQCSHLVHGIGAF